MRLYKFIVMMRHPDTGKATPISTLMAETGKQATRRAKALYTDDAWAVSEASQAVDDGRADRLLQRFWKEDKRWRAHHFDDEDDYERQAMRSSAIRRNQPRRNGAEAGRRRTKDL